MAADILCIIPARGGSKRIPKKNIALLKGKPLISYTIEAAVTSGLFASVIVSTEDDEIASVSESSGAVVYKRDPKLASDTATVVETCLDVLEVYEGSGKTCSHICVLLPTSPFRTSEDIQSAMLKLMQSNGNAVMAVTSYEIPPFWALSEREGFLSPHFGKQYMIRSQDLPSVSVDNGAIYIVETEVFKKEKLFYTSKLVGYHMSRDRSIDIDESLDLHFAEFLMSKNSMSEVEK
ncbi:cytidylyltransferase domain-containing protein [Nanoarchaeota archaeon]